MEKYGEKKAKRVYAAMLKNYEGVRLVDTGGGLQEESRDYVRRTAQLLELNYGEVTGTCQCAGKAAAGRMDGESASPRRAQPLTSQIFCAALPQPGKRSGKTKENLWRKYY